MFYLLSLTVLLLCSFSIIVWKIRTAETAVTVKPVNPATAIRSRAKEPKRGILI